MSKRKFVARKLGIFLTTSLLATFSYFCKKITDYTEKIATIPWDIRNELYYDDILDDQEYLEYYGRTLSTGEYISKATNTNKLMDKFATYEALKKLEEADVHMDITRNLDFLKKCPNLKTLNIFSAELLTDEDIEYINNSNVEKVVLMFNSSNIRRIRDEKFDLSRIHKDVIINNSFYSFIDDLDQLLIYNYFENATEDMYVDKNNLESIKKMDNYLNRVIENNGIMYAKDDKEKIFLISNYICNTIEYDEDVSDSIDKYTKKLEEDEKAYYEPNSKTEDYNFHSISTIINQTTENKSGVCVNYASLFDILCYKTGIKSRIVDGMDNNLRLGHAWNIVYLGDDKEYVDLTFYDKSFNEYILNEYKETKSKEDYEILNESLFHNIDESYTDFHLFKPIEELDQEIKKENVYEVNMTLDGLLVVNKEPDYKKVIAISFLPSLVIVSLDELIRKNKKKKILKK